jgi:nitrogen regulatory protein PII
MPSLPNGWKSANPRKKQLFRLIVNSQLNWKESIMRFKLILAFVDDDKTDALLDAARNAGATGATIINNARGEGLKKARGIFGMEITTQRDVLLFLVEEHHCRRILETIAEVGEFDDSSGTGIALQLDVEDALGVKHQINSLSEELKDEI